MRIAAFDIETDGLPAKDWDKLSPVVGITCACAVVNAEDRVFTQFWWAGMEQMRPDERPVGLDDLQAAAQAGTLIIRAKMTENEVDSMFDQLLNLLLLADCKPLFTWNGASFDWPVIASHIPDRRREVIHLALTSYDPCFQFNRTYGWPIGLSGVAQAMLGRGKEELDGAKAATMWPFEGVDKILAYVHGDAQLTIDAVQAIAREKKVMWINSKGDVSMQLIDPPYNNNPAWHTVKALAARTYGKGKDGVLLTEPDRSWMDDPTPFELPAVLGWTEL